MPKRMLTTICGLFALLGLSACSGETEPEDVGGVVTVERYVAEGEARPLGELRSPDDLTAFRHAYRTADKISGALKMTTPDYEIRFAADGEEKTFWFWISPAGKKGMVVDTSRTETGYAVDAESNAELRRRIVSIPYGWEQSERYGDVAQGPSGTIHLEKWQNFLTRLDRRQPASVQIALYTDEGHPIFENLEYDGRVIHYTYDNSQDAYGSPKKKIETCEKIADRRKLQSSDDPLTEYTLDGCVGSGGGSFNLLVRDSDLEASLDQADGVTVRRGLPGGEAAESVFGRLQDGTALQAFRKAYETAKKTNAEPDVEAPDYEASFRVGEERKRVRLWFGNQGKAGMLADVTDGNAVYAELTPRSAERLYGLIAEIPYDSERAAENGDLVVKPGGELINREKWNAFADAAAEKRPASISIVSYTLEGDPIFKDLNYDGRVIRYRYDNTHDDFGTADKRFDTCEKLALLPMDEVPGSKAVLDGCSDAQGGRNDSFELRLPAEAARP